MTAAIDARRSRRIVAPFRGRDHRNHRSRPLDAVTTTTRHAARAGEPPVWFAPSGRIKQKGPTP
jgi:hypothetical protein